MSNTNGKCDVAGCIAHITDDFTCHESGDIRFPKHTYNFRAHFKTMDEILECAAKEVARRCQQGGRKGKFPADRTVDVNAEGKYEITIADRAAAFHKMSPEQQAAELAIMQEIIKAASAKK